MILMMNALDPSNEDMNFILVLTVAFFGILLWASNQNKDKQDKILNYFAFACGATVVSMACYAVFRLFVWLM